MRGHTRQRTITPKLSNLIFSLFGAVFNGLNLNFEFEPDISSNKDSVPQVPITLFAGPPHFVNCLL